MSLGTFAIGGQLALRGRLQFRAPDGTVLKEVDIVDGSLPAVAGPSAAPACSTAAPELPHANPA